MAEIHVLQTAHGVCLLLFLEQLNVEISVNGEPRQVESGCTVAKLLVELKLQPRYLAVERNQELVPRSTHATCVLQSGDCVEIVTLVGGG